jgi:predicted HTH transcriptional regulator
MIPFPELEDCTKFPYPEGIHFEFKCSFRAVDAKTKTKLVETICAFLNTDGGYLIVGIQDDTREFLGIEINKKLDAFFIRCDNIYHNDHIVHEDGTAISPGTVTAFTVPANGKTLCVVKATPEPGQKYRLNTGEMYYRLSASNFHLLAKSESITMRVSEFHHAIFNKTRQIKEDYQKLVRYTVEVEKKYSDDQIIKESMSDHYKALMQKYEEATKLLHESILQQKKMKEEELYGKQSKDDWGDMRALCCLLA